MSQVTKTSFVPGKTVLLGGSPKEDDKAKVWGKKITLDPAARDRIEERRIRYDVINLVDQYEVEYNDEYTRTSIRTIVERYLRSLREQRAIYDYNVICDQRNNTPHDIERGDIQVRADYQRHDGTWVNILS